MAQELRDDETVDSLFKMSLEDLMNIKIKVASQKAMTLRESPGIVTVITEEEIINSGAVDLVDVLRLVPGIEMAVDVWGVTGITIRGNLGYIGRVLLMIDGLEVNELLYSCSLLGNHYPVTNIKRIEIIRGPGSSIYGGFAELGVINVITKLGEDLNGISVSIDYGQMAGSASHRNVTLSAGKKINGFEFAVHGFFGLGNRSDREYTDVYGNKYDMENQANLDTVSLNTAASYKGFSARFIYDDYKTTTRDWYDEIVAKDYEVTYETLLGELKYDWKITDKLTLTPKYNYMLNIPWSSMDTAVPGDGIFYRYERQVRRNKINLTGSFDANKKINIIAGGEYYRDDARENHKGDKFWNGKSKIDYNNMSGFAQGVVKSDLVNVTCGGRVDKHSEYGTAFSPRLGLTRVKDELHFKLLYSRAFRAPAVEEINFNFYLNPNNTKPTIKPEKAEVIEFETGYILADDISIVANVYYIKVDDTIVYFDSPNVDGYDNRGVSGSKGFEVEYRLMKNWGYTILNYSYYNAKDINDVTYYAVGNKERQLLGTSPHKITFNGSYNIYKGLSGNPSIIYLGKRYAYTRYNTATDNMVLSEQDPVILCNLYFNYKNLFIEGLNFGIGVYNILDNEYDFIEPYNGWHAPLPGHSRRLIARVSYNTKF